jgi:cholesterol transport system auxiliary component
LEQSVSTKTKRAGSFVFRSLLALLGGVLLLSACSALQAPQTQTPTIYLLEAPPAAGPEQPKRDLVLAVSPPRAWPGFDTPQMAYVRQPQQLDYFVKNRWADAPSRMLAPILARTLALDGRFLAVVPMPSVVPADLRLDTEIMRLLQDFSTQPSRAQFTVRAQLTDLRSKRVLATREFNEIETASNDDAAGGVSAANRALGRMLRQLADFCAEQSGGR